MGLFDRILRRLRGAPEPARQDAPGLFTARSPGTVTERSGASEDPAPPEDLWDRPDATPAAGDVDTGSVEPDVPEPVVVEPGVLEPEGVAPEDGTAEPIDAGDGTAESIDPDAELAAIEELAPPAAEPETPVAAVWHEAAEIGAGATTELPEQTAAAAAPPEPAVEDAPVDDRPVEDDVAPAGSTADEPLFAAYEEAPEPPAAEEPAPEPVPPLFALPEVATEPEPEDVAPEDVAPEVAADVEPERPPLVVETHPEIFDPAPAADAGPAAAPAADEPVPGGEPVAGEDPTAVERTMRVHDARLDKRPGPIRMTPSEAIRLAQDGPRSTRRPDDAQS